MRSALTSFGEVLGLGFIAAAAFLVAVPLGLLVVGAALILVSRGVAA